MSHSESDQTQPKKDEYFPYGSDYELSPPPKKSLLGLIVENPGPVVGILATTTALGMGMGGMMSGESAFQQKMMRYRVVAQFATVSLAAAAFALSSWRSKTDDANQ